MAYITKRWGDWKEPAEVDLLQTSHNAPVPYTTMHNFITEMCTCMNISVTKGCIGKYVMGLMRWASYHIRKIAGFACAGNAGNVFPRRRFQRETLVSDPGMHHGTCVTHVPWCMSGSLTCGDRENVPGIPGACAPTILRIWQEAHGPIRSHKRICIWLTICLGMKLRLTK